MATNAPLPALFLPEAAPEPNRKPSHEPERYTAFLNGLLGRLPAPPAAIVLAFAGWEASNQQIISGGSTEELVLGLDLQSRFAAECIRAELLETPPQPDPRASGLLSRLQPQPGLPLAALSVNPKLVPEEHYRIGQALQGLREQGVLLVGCAPIPADPAAGPWSDWLHEQLQLWHTEALFDYPRRLPTRLAASPFAAAQPPAALAPLLICMGAADPARECRRLYKELNNRGRHLSVWRFG